MIPISQVYRTPGAEVLRELSDSRYTVFDVLPAFFVNKDPWVTLGRVL
jgi:acetyl-CoA carboxylase / biotin carboxylase 1